MMFRFFSFLLFLSSAFLLQVANAQTLEKQSKIDSLYALVAASQGEQKLDNYYQLARFTQNTTDYERREKMIDDFIKEAQQQKNIGREGYARMCKVFLLYEQKDRVPDFFDELPKYLAFAEKNQDWKNYYYVWSWKVNLLISLIREEEAIQTAKEIYQKAKQMEHTHGMGTSEYLLGELYKMQKCYEEAEVFYKKAIENFTIANEKSDIIKAYQALTLILRKLRKYDEELAVLSTLEILQEDRDKEFGFKEFSSWLYIDVEYANVYRALGKMKKAENYYHKIENYLPQLLPIEQTNYYNQVLSFYELQKNYTSALAATDSIMKINAMEGIPTELLILQHRAWLLGYLGQGEEAVELYETIIAKKDSIDNITIATQLNELRSKYDIDILELKSQRQHQLIVFAFGVFCLLLFIIGIIIFNHRKLIRKNSSLVQQIKKQNALEQKIEMMRIQMPPTDGVDKRDSLFDTLTALMKEQLIFTNSELTYKDITTLINTNKQTLYACIKNNTGFTFQQYINDLRLNYACFLILSDNDLTIDSIAVDSGFGSRATFYRLFNEKYSMSPHAFRKLTQTLPFV